MAQLGYINTGTHQSMRTKINIPMNENICGMLFDLAFDGDVFAGYPKIRYYFANDEVHLIHNMKEAEDLGIVNNNFLNGLVYFHLSAFYDYIGGDAPLYLCMSDCSQGFDILGTIFTSSSNNIFQVGVCTTRNLWRFEDDEYHFGEVVTQLKNSLNLFVDSEQSVSAYISPINVLLQALPDEMNAVLAPDCADLNCPKMSILLGDGVQQSSYMGIMGISMACLYLSSAEESIAYVKKYNLNKYDNFYAPSMYGVENEIDREILSLKGYIFPMTYESKPGCAYLSSDSTCSSGDYNTLRANRLIHKIKRIIMQTMLPRINSSIFLDSNGFISTAEITEITNEFYQSISSQMVNPEGQRQIKDCVISIPANQSVLETDQIKVKCSIIQHEPANNIDFETYINI